ncbi:MAG: PilW family protein [Candidatus Humimicrobiaceae bacterium]
MNLKKFAKCKIFNWLKKENGFGLVEMLIVVFIIAIIATVISLLYISSVRSQRDLLNKAGLEANLRTTLYSMTKDIREATSVSKAESDSLEFRADINNDSVSEDVEYIFSGLGPYTLNKKINGGSDIFIMSYIRDKNIFSYFSDSSEDSKLQPPLDAQNLSSFKMIKIEFIVNRESSNPVKEVSLSTFVSLRNR